MGNVLENVLDVVVNVVNSILRGLVALVDILLIWMPDCPFVAAISSVEDVIGNEMIGYVNYFLPISEIAAFLVLWLAAVLLYYAVSVLLRWKKIIS